MYRPVIGMVRGSVGFNRMTSVTRSDILITSISRPNTYRRQSRILGAPLEINPYGRSLHGQVGQDGAGISQFKDVEVEDSLTWTAFEELNKNLKHVDELTDDEWTELRENLIGLPFDEDKYTTRGNVDTVVFRYLLEGSRLKTGVSFHQYLSKVKKTGHSWSQLDYFLKLLQTVDDLKEYEHLVKNVNETILDKGYGNVVSSLYWSCLELQARTSFWREALDTALATPHEHNGSCSVQTFTALALKAFQVGDHDLMWAIMDNRHFHNDIIRLREKVMVVYNQCHDKMYLNWISYCVSLQEDLAIKKMEDLFKYFERHTVFLTDQVKNAILEFYSQGPISAVQTKMWSDSGICPNCKSPLDYVGEECLDTLRKSVLDAVIGKSKDVYTTTDPRELDSSLKLVDRWGPFDVVIDGLNVQYIQIPRRYQNIPKDTTKYLTQMKREILLSPLAYESLNLWDVVNHFIKKGSKVLVVTRRANFKRLPHSKRILKVATCLMLGKVTQDDPYMILAALQSGRGCKLVTNDLLRQHNTTLAKFGGPQLAKTFTEWQAQHQVRIAELSGYYKEKDQVTFSDPQFVWPPSHNIKAHVTQQYWHLPLVTHETEGLLNIPKSWLCVGPKL